MSQKDIGNKIPIYKLKAGKEVEDYYDEWTVENKYDKDMVDWKYSGPQETVTLFKKHNSKRVNIEAIKQSIEYHDDYHIKPVLDKELSMVEEVEVFLKECEIPNEKVWAMPAGDDRESLMESYPEVMNFVRDRGWRFTGRSHIMAFNTERCV